MQTTEYHPVTSADIAMMYQRAAEEEGRNNQLRLEFMSFLFRLDEGRVYERTGRLGEPVKYKRIANKLFITHHRNCNAEKKLQHRVIWKEEKMGRYYNYNHLLGIIKNFAEEKMDYSAMTPEEIADHRYNELTEDQRKIMFNTFSDTAAKSLSIESRFCTRPTQALIDDARSHGIDLHADEIVSDEEFQKQEILCEERLSGAGFKKTWMEDMMFPGIKFADSYQKFMSITLFWNRLVKEFNPDGYSEYEGE